MSRELRITASMPIPESIGEKADLMTKASNAIAELSRALGCKVEWKEVTIGERKSRALGPIVMPPGADDTPASNVARLPGAA